jgi:dephospho-CoA kinase
MSCSMIVGLCGSSLPGRSEIAKLLIDHRFMYYSVQNEVSEDMRSRKMKISPEECELWDDEVRKKEGPAFWVQRILSRISQHAVIDGIQHEEEVLILKKSEPFVLIGVYAPAEIRFARALAQEEMLKRKEGITDVRVDETLDEFRILKFIDYSIPYPAKELEKQIDTILKTTSTKK